MDRRTLTEREIDVVRLTADGRSNPEIARLLEVSVATVKRHLANVMIKWNVRNRTIVAIEARDRGLVLAEDAAEYTPTSPAPKPPRTSKRPAAKKTRKTAKTQGRSSRPGRRAQKRTRRKG